MRLAQTILLSLTICLLVIGVHQSTLHGFANSYWIFMLMFIALILFQTAKNKSLEKEKEEGKNKIADIQVIKKKKKGQKQS